MYKDYRQHHFDKDCIKENTFSIMTIILWILAISFLFYIIISHAKEYDGKEESLRLENARLLNQIQNMTDSNAIIVNELFEMQTEYSQLNIDNAELKIKIKDQKKIIQSLKEKYEKANHFSNNYNADSVRIYFSNIENY
jgi:uncharacterized membrane protein